MTSFPFTVFLPSASYDCFSSRPGYLGTGSCRHSLWNRGREMPLKVHAAFWDNDMLFKLLQDTIKKDQAAAVANMFCRHKTLHFTLFRCLSVSHKLWIVPSVLDHNRLCLLFSRWVGRCTTPAATSLCDWIRSTWWTSREGQWRIATVWRRYGYTLAARTARAPNTCWTDRPSPERCVDRRSKVSSNTEHCLKWKVKFRQSVSTGSKVH